MSPRRLLLALAAAVATANASGGLEQVKAQTELIKAKTALKEAEMALAAVSPEASSAAPAPTSAPLASATGSAPAALSSPDVQLLLKLVLALLVGILGVSLVNSLRGPPAPNDPYGQAHVNGMLDRFQNFANRGFIRALHGRLLRANGEALAGPAESMNNAPHGKGRGRGGAAAAAGFF